MLEKDSGSLYTPWVYNDPLSSHRRFQDRPVGFAGLAWLAGLDRSSARRDRRRPGAARRARRAGSVLPGRRACSGSCGVPARRRPGRRRAGCRRGSPCWSRTRSSASSPEAPRRAFDRPPSSWAALFAAAAARALTARSAFLPASTMTGSVSTIVRISSVTSMAIWRRPACSGCSSEVPVTCAERSFARSSSRSTPSEARAADAAELRVVERREQQVVRPDGERPRQPRGLLERGLDRRGAARRGLGARHFRAEGDARGAVPAQPGPQPAQHGVGLLGALARLGRVARLGGVTDTASSTAARISRQVRVVAQDLDGDALALPDQPEQDVLGADVVVLDRRAPRAATAPGSSSPAA